MACRFRPRPTMAMIIPVFIPFYAPSIVATEGYHLVAHRQPGDGPTRIEISKKGGALRTIMKDGRIYENTYE